MRKKAIRLRVTYEVDWECPEDWTQEDIEFHYEENFCLDNFVLRMAREIHEKPSVCHTCFKGSCDVLGEAT